MAGAGAGANASESFTVPLYTPDPKEGTLTYLRPRSVCESFEGFFSFTFYIRDEIVGAEETPKTSRIYLEGLSVYTSIITKSPFQNWAMLVYTDQFTIDQMDTIMKTKYGNDKNHETNENKGIQQIVGELLANPRCIFVIVNWPRHQRRTTRSQVNGPALRPFRSRAPFDFPTKPICIRDADTLFDDELKFSYTRYAFQSQEMFDKLRSDFPMKLLQWESTMLSRTPSIQEILNGNPPLIVGTGGVGRGIDSHLEGIYKRPWHSNELTGKNAPFGVFAGFVNVFPGIPVYQTSAAWDEFVEYMNSRSRRLNEFPSSALENRYRKRELIKDPLKVLNTNSVNKYVKEMLSSYHSTNPHRAKLEAHFQAQKNNVLYRFSDDNIINFVGRDEQLYLFIIMPKAIPNLFIFRQNMGDFTEPKIDLEYHTRFLAMYTFELKHDFRFQSMMGLGRQRVSRRSKRKGAKTKKLKKGSSKK